VDIHQNSCFTHWTDGQTDRQTDRQIHAYIFLHSHPDSLGEWYGYDIVATMALYAFVFMCVRNTPRMLSCRTARTRVRRVRRLHTYIHTYIHTYNKHTHTYMCACAHYNTIVYITPTASKHDIPSIGPHKDTKKINFFLAVAILFYPLTTRTYTICLHCCSSNVTSVAERSQKCWISKNVGTCSVRNFACL
jgi:hypothetical protein